MMANQIQALSIECSAQAKPLLEKLLGSATVVVKNGGLEPKLVMIHRLKEPADESADELKKREFAAKLELICEFVAKIAGVIASSMHIPQLDSQLCRIIDQNPDATVDLDVALRALVKAARNGGGAPVTHPDRPTPGAACDPLAGANSIPNTDLATPAEFLQKLRPGGPWMPTAIVQTVGR